MNGPARARLPLHYVPKVRMDGGREGPHRSRRSGDAGPPRASRPLAPGQMSRRFDVSASLRDPWSRLWVRENIHLARIDVNVLLDLSSSMYYKGTVDRFEQTMDLLRRLADSVIGHGDRFGIVPIDQRLRADLKLHPTRSPALCSRVLDALALEGGRMDARQGNPDSWQRVVHDMPRHGMCFVLTDALWPIDQFERMAERLRGCDWIPVILLDRQEQSLPSRHGLMRLRDMESGRERLYLTRPSLSVSMRLAEDARRTRIEVSCARAGTRPLWVEGRFDPLAFNRYFASRRAL